MSWLLEIALSNAVVATVMALLVLMVSRICRRPALIHSLWLIVLLKLITPPVIPVSVGVWRTKVADSHAADSAAANHVTFSKQRLLPVSGTTPTNDKQPRSQRPLGASAELDDEDLMPGEFEIEDRVAGSAISTTVDQNDEPLVLETTDTTATAASEGSDLNGITTWPAVERPLSALPIKSAAATSISVPSERLAHFKNGVLSLLPSCLIAA